MAKNTATRFVKLCNLDRVKLVFTRMSDDQYVVEMPKLGKNIEIDKRKDGSWVADCQAICNDWVEGRTAKQAFRRYMRVINNSVTL